jgi:hypothetical protein
MARSNIDDARINNGIFTGKFNLPVREALAAAGSTNADAAAIVGSGITRVSGADDAKGVILPEPQAPFGEVVIIKVLDGADLKVYPNAGAQINALTATTGAITVVDDVCFMLVAVSKTQWYTLPLLPS